MTAPDFSLPDSPNLRDAFRAFAPPGTDTDDLMAALRQARMIWCRACSRSHPDNLICPEQNAIAAKAADPDMPADPSPGDLMAGIGIAQMLESMTSGGVPLASAERIIGAMLAVHGIMAAADDDHRD